MATTVSEHDAPLPSLEEAGDATQDATGVTSKQRKVQHQLAPLPGVTRTYLPLCVSRVQPLRAHPPHAHDVRCRAYLPACPTLCRPTRLRTPPAVEEYIRTSDSDMFIRRQQVAFDTVLTPSVTHTVMQYIGSLGLDCGQVEFTWTARAGTEPRKMTHALPDIPADLSLQKMGIRAVRGTVTAVYSLR